MPERLFEKLVALQVTPDKLRGALIELFEKMQRGGLFGMEAIPWFNGGLFQKIDVPMITPMDVAALKTASTLNWSAIDVAIFGTLFERGLDPKKRSQLGAHYTDPATIMRIVTPVVERPLRAEWATAREEIATLRAKSKKYNDAAYLKARAAATRFLERLANYRVLDPACGSGNFLYLALKTLKDIEHSIHIDIQTTELDRPVNLVTSPANVLGIELNEYAAELARVTVWIGELQWRLQHGYPFKQNPVLEPLDHIECRDALLSPLPQRWSEVNSLPQRGRAGVGAGGVTPNLAALNELPPPQPSPAGGGGLPRMTEALWPRADAVIGNPPFVGGSKKRRELGDETFEALAKIYEGRVPPGADLVCYWFDKALQQMKHCELARAGFVSTNSIRGGSNRDVLDAIVKDGVITDAWSDEPWVNDGAAVRVSLISYALNTSDTRNLNGDDVQHIYADLTGDAETAGAGAAVDSTNVEVLIENANTVFEGLRKDGPLDVDGPTARRWLRAPNPNGRSNAAVIFPLINGMDITRRPRDGWVIDTGEAMSEADAAFFEQPFRQLTEVVRPVRAENNDRIRRTFWWRFGRNGERLRAALKPIHRYINTPRVAKHRLFVLQPHVCIPDTATVAIARADDATFGILHSRFHELWSLRMCTWLGVGNDPRYTPTTCFETFPFPAGLTPRDTKDQRTEVLADGAVIPAFYSPLPQAGEGLGVRVAGERVSEIDRNSPINDHPHPSPLPLAGEGTEQVRNHAIAIARAAKRLNDLRERWLNPPEWTEAVPEVIPLGMEKSPYPDRILPRANLGAADLAELKKRTLTNLYNQRPAWLADAHAALDAAVAAAYGWTDYSAAMTDNEILARLLALNHERAAPA